MVLIQQKNLRIKRETGREGVLREPTTHSVLFETGMGQGQRPLASYIFSYGLEEVSYRDDIDNIKIFLPCSRCGVVIRSSSVEARHWSDQLS